jgi:hypothetical protein
MLTRMGGLRGWFWRSNFLRRLRSTLDAIRPHDRAVIVEDTRREAVSLYEQRITDDLDRKGHMIVTMCSHVLAAYRAVLSRTGDAALAFKVVQQTMESTLRTPLLWMLRVFLKLYRDPVGKLSRMDFVERGRKGYGKTMEFDEEHTPDGVDMLVRRCAFHQFFVDHGVPGLTIAVCNWDRNWMDLLNESKRPIRSERPTTISTGGDCCRFRFIRDPDKRERDADDVVSDALAQQSQNRDGPAVTYQITLSSDRLAKH